MRPQPRMQNKKAYEHSHHGHTGVTRHSPRNGFNGFLRALPGDRALLSPSQQVTTCQLDASVEASGPHDFAVRVTCCSSKAPSASTASRPAFVTIASRPSLGRDGSVIILIWVRREPNYFFNWDWIAQISLIRFNKF